MNDDRRLKIYTYNISQKYLKTINENDIKKFGKKKPIFLLKLKDIDSHNILVAEVFKKKIHDSIAININGKQCFVVYTIFKAINKESLYEYYQKYEYKGNLKSDLYKKHNEYKDNLKKMKEARKNPFRSPLNNLIYESNWTIKKPYQGGRMK